MYRNTIHLVDDGYYYLQIAFQVAQGKGLTFDGLHHTNGFQPLWQIILVPFWEVFDKSLAPYALMVFQSLLFIGSGIFLYINLQRLLHNTIQSCLASFLWIANIWIINKGAITGMETGLVLSACIVLYFYVENRKKWLFSAFYLQGLLKSVAFAVPESSRPRYRMVQYINTHLPSNALLASWDAGYLGYYCRQPVVNLYGYVNDGNLYQYLLQDRLMEYIEQEDIDYVVNKNCHGYKHQFILNHPEEWKRIHAETLELLDIQQKTAFTVNPNVLEASNYDTLEYFIIKSTKTTKRG